MVVLIGAGGCSGSDPTSSPDTTKATEKTTTTEASDSTPTTTTSSDGGIVDVVVQPGLATDDFVGARQDVTIDTCKEAEGGGWTASGEVTNSSGADADYRIYVALNVDSTSETRALVQVDASLADGETKPWEVTIPVKEIYGLSCILRVERVAAA